MDTRSTIVSSGMDKAKQEAKTAWAVQWQPQLLDDNLPSSPHNLVSHFSAGMDRAAFPYGAAGVARGKVFLE